MIGFSHQFSGSKLTPDLCLELLPLSLAFLLEEHRNYIISLLVLLFISSETTEVELPGTDSVTEHTRCVAVIRRMFKWLKMTQENFLKDEHQHKNKTKI